MNKISKRRNPNTKQFWEDIYTEHIDHNKIRSDDDRLLKLMPLFEKSESVLDFGGGLGGNMKYLSEKLEN